MAGDAWQRFILALWCRCQQMNRTAGFFKNWVGWIDFATS